MNRFILSRRILLLMPIIVLYMTIGFLPFSYIVQFSLTDGFGSYERVLSNPITSRVIENTLATGTLSTLVSVPLGYLLAAALWRTHGLQRSIIMGLILLPFWSGALIKLFGWSTLLHDYGAINTLLQNIGLTDGPIQLLHNRFAVVFGMVHHCIPFAVFPIFASMLSIDEQTEKAATSLGASRFSVFRFVILPLTLPGVYSGALLVFIISIGFYLTPVFLGGPREMMIANLVAFYAHELVDLSAASALAVLVVVSVSILIFVYQWLPKEGQYETR